MKNKPIDLHNHLFEQLERINDEDLKGEAYDRESKRAQDMCNIAGHIIANRNSVVAAMRLRAEWPQINKETLLLE
jgi:hypothetical protein